MLDTALSVTLPAKLRDRSLTIASVELGRVLTDHGKLTFRNQGTCMFPCVQPDDILHIESRSIEEIQVGDIAVFWRENLLFGHRTILKGTCDGKPYIITRPDRSRYGNDGPRFAGDVLGVVTGIERRGVPKPLQPQPLGSLKALRTAAWEWWSWKALPHLSKQVAALQIRNWYLRLASVWFNFRRPHFSFVVRVPLTANQSHYLYREMSSEKFDISQMSWQSMLVSRWLLSLYLNGAPPTAASVTINLHPEGCLRGAGWWVDEMEVRARYRGLGLDEALIQQAQPILAHAGMTLQGINR